MEKERFCRSRKSKVFSISAGRVSKTSSVTGSALSSVVEQIYSLVGVAPKRTSIQRDAVALFSNMAPVPNTLLPSWKPVTEPKGSPVEAMGKMSSLVTA